MNKILNIVLPALVAGLVFCSGCVVPDPWIDRPYGPPLSVPPVGGAAFEEPIPGTVPVAAPVVSPLFDAPFYEESTYFSEPRYWGRPLPPPHPHGRRPLPPPRTGNLHHRAKGDVYRPIDKTPTRFSGTRSIRPANGNKLTRTLDTNNGSTRPTIRPRTNGTTPRHKTSRPMNNGSTRSPRASGNRNGGRVAPIRRR